jgi:cytochrome oxidase assembly protein ShyY1
VYRFLLTPGWLGRIAAAVAVVTAMVLLGGWQLDRYEERSAINARIDAAGAATPAALTEVLAPPVPGQRVGPPAPGGAAWTVVTATGHFDPANEILVRNRTVQGRVGFEVLTPLVLPDGSAVLVDRGWVPPAPQGSAARPDVPPAPSGRITVLGRMRPTESGARPVERHQGTLQTRRINIEALATHLPYPLYHGYLLLDTPADPALTPIPVRRENAWLNAGYAAQWWIFAGLAVGGFGWLARREADRLRQAAAGPVRRAENGTGH